MSGVWGVGSGVGQCLRLSGWALDWVVGFDRGGYGGERLGDVWVGLPDRSLNLSRFETNSPLRRLEKISPRLPETGRVLR